MRVSFQSLLHDLKAIQGQFDPAAQKRKTQLLRQIGEVPIPLKSIEQYQDILLFLSAYPANKTFLKRVSKEFTRIARTLHMPNIKPVGIENTGLPYISTVANFSHTLLQWMCEQKDYSVRLDSFGDDGISLSEVLRLTLPDLEKHLTFAGYSNEELFTTLGIPPGQRLSFLLAEIGKLDRQDIREYLFEKLRVFVSVTPKNRTFSKVFNRLPSVVPFYHDTLLKHFDSEALLNSELPSPAHLTSAEATHLTGVIRHDLALLQRETDPATHLEPRSLKLYHLERGISIALYTMTPAWQLPIESYVGYTLFKNGYPTAYGGAWVLGTYALFGINVHDAFRGGESGYILCQLLRTYRQIFHVDYFEVEPYQYGLDNPEGITSGAYWFYYHYGFRSVDRELQKLAEREYVRRKKQPQYRTPHRILEKFTESNCALQLGRKTPLSMYVFLEKISKMIMTRYRGDRNLAIQQCVKNFRKLTQVPDVNADQENVLIDIALLHEALHVRSAIKRALLVEMIRVKSENMYRYQECLRTFLR